MDISDINSELISALIKKEFRNINENITPLKILSRFGISIHDQKAQIQMKPQLKKIKIILGELSVKGEIERKEILHDTLGIREDAYKITKTTLF